MVLSNFNGTGVGFGFGFGCGFGVGWGFGGMPLNVFGLGTGGGCGVGLGLGWGFGTAFGSQYRSSRVTFWGSEFSGKDESLFTESKDLLRNVEDVIGRSSLYLALADRRRLCEQEDPTMSASWIRLSQILLIHALGLYLIY